MDTPQLKRTFDVLSPVSDSEIQEEKRRPAIHKLTSMADFDNSSQAGSSMGKVTKKLVGNSDIDFLTAPPWGKAINSNLHAIGHK